MYCDWPLLGRCCFCLPLRRGVLTFGYINLLSSAFLVGVYSYAVHRNLGVVNIYHGTANALPSELCVAIYCLEVIFNAILIYGAHKRSVLHVRVYYYFAIATTIAPVLMAFLDYTNYAHFGIIIEMVLMMTAALFLNIYLILLVRSLLRKMEMDGPHLYDNPLNQIVTGEAKVEHNGIYNNTTVEPVDV